MKKLVAIFSVIVLVSLMMLWGCGSNTAQFPESNLSYNDAENEVGGSSKLSDDKKEDIFNSKYKYHWFTWEGEVVLAESDEVSINIDDFGTQDLQVDFADKKAGYNLKIGDHIKVRFLMTSLGGSFLPFGGEQAVIVQ